MKLDPKQTALLTLDCQKGILGFLPGAEVIIPNAANQAMVLTVDAFIAEQGE